MMSRSTALWGAARRWWPGFLTPDLSMLSFSFPRSARWLLAMMPWILGGLTLACEDTGKKSAQLARSHVEDLAQAAVSDVQEVRKGLPQGAEKLAPLFEDAHPEVPDPESAKTALSRARRKVPDLRVAKSTFFAVATPDGRVLRSDGDTDELAEKNIFKAFPKLKHALERGYVESFGSMKEAAGVRGREDAQWVAAAPVKVDDEIEGLYITGWSWSAYAYRLETAIRSQVLGNTAEGDKVPLLYVYVIAHGDIYGAPVSPMINAKAIMKLSPLEKLESEEIYSQPLEIDGRQFGVAVKRVPKLGEDVAIAVLRSET